MKGCKEKFRKQFYTIPQALLQALCLYIGSVFIFNKICKNIITIV